jgi:mono/diheme cytochrome c family protein
MPSRPRSAPVRRRAPASRTSWPTLALVCTLALTGAVARGAAIGQAVPPPADPAGTAPGTGSARAFLDQHCIGCHNDRARAAGLSLAAADPAHPAADAELWEGVLHKLTTGQMPPAGRPRPAAADLQAFVGALEARLDAAAASHPRPGRVGLHRLNRAEYANAVRDLLALDVDARTLLLPDEADEGFDNVAASLALSPAHLERYLAAAREISRLAVGDPALGAAPGTTTYRVARLLEQDVRVSDDTPFGARGGTAVRHTFPLDGTYAFKVRLRRQVYDYIIGMGHAQPLEVRLDGRLVKRFTVGGQAAGMPGPLTWNGEIVGETPYELYMHAADEGLEVRVPVTAGPHTVAVSFVAGAWEPDGIPQPLLGDFGRGADEQFDGVAAVDALVVQGPFDPTGPGDTPSRRAVFSCRPAGAADERACATRVLRQLARRAYRRPVGDDDLRPLLEFYDAAATARGFEGGVQAALERLLVSFNFLFRIERDPPGVAPGTAYRLGDHDLASRLSFFLWSSIPDETLLDLADRGQLAKPDVLDAQVRRMLRDPRASALVSNFAFQWLGIRKVESALPDVNLFPEFDENLRRAFLQETALFVEGQLREDRSVVDLVGADYTVVNARLAEHYGLRGVQGERFRTVTFADGTRGGLLGQGGILMLTSYPDRTTPVLRGSWVLENLLGMPPPPPPPNVPALEPTAPDGRPMSMREQMETHRQNPACSVCHVRMDPLGFALEHYDAIGRFRTRAYGAPIDASATFADGTPIDGAPGLRRFVLQHRDNYVRTVAAKLLTYALGRRVEAQDQPVVRAIVREAATGGHRWSAIILAIVKSTPFQMRTTATS